MSRFHSTERLGTVQSSTPEGFLICEGVPISRLGTMPYADGELRGVRAGSDGLVWVTRDEQALFDDNAVRSFEGKDVVLLHPNGEFVTARNWRQYAVGHAQHIRRGTGDQAHLLIADLLVKDADAIQAIRSRRIRDVSCGYDADYEQLEPGRARQVRILGNHIALVPEGRCGPTCSIGDSAMSLFKTLIERVRSARANNDDALFAASLAELERAETGGGGATAPVVVNVGTGDRDKAGKEPGAAAAPAADDFQGKTLDALNKITEGMTTLNTKFGELETKVKAMEAPAAAAGTKDGAAATVDSAGLKDALADAVARAEMIIPGGKGAPTFDAALPAEKTQDAICSFQRRVLLASMTTGTGFQHVEPFIAQGTDVGALTCDAVASAFRSASELARVSNNRGAASAGSPAGAAGQPRPPTATDINEANRKFWAKHNGVTV